METVDLSLVLSLVRTRLNRLDHSLDDYLTHVILAARDHLTRMGIDLGLCPGDTMLLTVYAVWIYGSRDQTGAQPDWLRKMIHDRLAQDKKHREVASP